MASTHADSLVLEHILLQEVHPKLLAASQEGLEGGNLARPDPELGCPKEGFHYRSEERPIFPRAAEGFLLARQETAPLPQLCKFLLLHHRSDTSNDTLESYILCPKLVLPILNKSCSQPTMTRLLYIVAPSKFNAECILSADFRGIPYRVAVMAGCREQPTGKSITPIGKHVKRLQSPGRISTRHLEIVSLCRPSHAGSVVRTTQKRAHSHERAFSLCGLSCHAAPSHSALEREANLQ